MTNFRYLHINKKQKKNADFVYVSNVNVSRSVLCRHSSLYIHRFVKIVMDYLSHASEFVPFFKKTQFYSSNLTTSRLFFISSFPWLSLRDYYDFF